MRPFPPLTAALLAGGVMLVLLPSSSEAQLGRLKKLGADAVKDAAKDKLVGKDTTATGAAKPAAAGGNASSNATSAPKAPARTANYTITAARIDLVVATLKPHVAAAEKNFALRKVIADYTAKRDAAQACFDRASKTFNPMSMMNQSEAQEKRTATVQAQAEAVNRRLNASREKDTDLRGSLFLKDSADALQMNLAASSMGSSCTYPFAPPAVIDAQVAEIDSKSSERASDGSTVEATADAKQSMTWQEFGKIRERMALWLMAQSNPSLQKGSEGTFTAEEHAAMSAKAAELKGLTPLFASSALRWSSWGDVKNW
jgi:hypothetical protein